MRHATWGLVLTLLLVALSAQGQFPPPPPGLSTGDPPTPCVSIHVRVPAEAAPGADLTYRITVENTTQAPAHHVLVRATLPKNARFVRGAPEPDATTPVVLWKVGTLGAGKRALRTLVVRPSGDDLTLCARVQFEHGQCVRTRLVRPGLQVRRLGPTVASVNDTLTYRLQVTNNGRATARNVVLLETLPSGVRFIDSKTPTKGDNPLEFKLGDLAPGRSRTVEYFAHALEAGAFTIKGEVKADGGLRREITPTTVDVRQKGIQVEMVGPEAPVKVNDKATFRIIVTNTGTAEAKNVRVSDELPTVISFEGSTGGGKMEGRVVRWTIGTIPAGGKQEVTLDVSCARTGTFTNVCTVTADGGLREQGKAAATFEPLMMPPAK